jgi:PST family polysaccharide transporter
MSGNSDFQDLKKKSLAGMGALFVRQVLVKVIFFVGNIVLARILAPQVFGVYAIVSFVVQFFSTFGDVGIGAALIQKKGELSREELATTFWLQQALVWLVVAIAVVVAPLALKVYPTLPPAGVWLIRAMAVSFLLSSLKTIPAILMERSIDFKRIAWVDITENLAFQAVAISCALMGLEVWSFILAAIVRAFVGAVVIYALSPWRPSLLCRLDSVRGLVRFGLPYQSNQILSFIKDAVTPLFVGAYAGAAAVGYVNWARNVAFAPLMVSESFGRVAFPAFSRLQDNRELLARTVERSIRMMTLVMLPVTAIMVALGPDITRVVFTDKWLPGIGAFYLFCTSPAGIGIFLPLYSAILSTGRTRVLLAMTVGLIVFEWGLGVPFVIKYGFIGIAMTQPITAVLFTCLYKLVLADDGIRVMIIRNVYCQSIASALAGVVARGVACNCHLTLISLMSLAGLSIFIYGLAVFVIRRDLFDECREYVGMMMLKGGNAKT